jgi:hypothetical protein
MSSLRKAVSRAATGKKRKTSRTAGGRKPAGRKAGAKRSSRKTGAGVTFSAVWKKLGQAVLRSALADCGWSREALVAKLSGDGELQRLVVQKTIGLLRLVVWPPNELDGPTSRAPKKAGASGEHTLGDECALGAGVAGSAGENASWQLF